MSKNIDDTVTEIEEGHPTLSETDDFASGSGEVEATDEDGAVTSNDEKLLLNSTAEESDNYVLQSTSNEKDNEGGKDSDDNNEKGMESMVASKSESQESEELSLVDNNHNNDTATGCNGQQNYSRMEVNKGEKPSISTKPKSFRNQKQDEFVKSGARVKSLLTTALRVAAGSSSGNTNKRKERDEVSGQVGGDEDRPSRKTWQSKRDFANIQDLAQEKAEECMALKRKVQDAQSQIQALQNEQTASEESNSQLKAKIDRTLEALQIAGRNAANARAEADASNARAESLSVQLNDLQSVIEETKRGLEVVRREHDEVSRASRSIEGRLIQVESELIRAARAKKDAEAERDFLKTRTEKSEKLARELQDKVDDDHDEIRVLKKDILELEELERTRQDRTNRIESEFQEARTGLLEATCAAAEAESTVTSLRSVIEELRRENVCLHEQIESSRDNQSKERSKQNEALTQAERNAQKWKMKVEDGEEEIRKLKIEKTTAEKQVAVEKSRVANMERRLSDTGKVSFGAEKSSSSPAAPSSAVTPHHNSTNLGFINSLGAAKDDVSVVSEENKKHKVVTELPKRDLSASSSFQKEKENKSKVNMKNQQLQRSASLYNGAPKTKAQGKSNVCVLCNRSGGLLLKCQCDDLACTKRGHPTCIGKFRGNSKSDSKTVLCGEVA